jgi:proton-translocating NADH-quinone oxidoreductase chain N
MPALFLILPIIGIFIINIPAKKWVPRIGFWVALAVSLAYIAMAATSAGLIWQGLSRFLEANLPFAAKLQIDLKGAIALATIGLIAFISIFIDRHTAKLKRHNFANLLLIIMAGMSGIVMVRDLVSLYVFLEITGVSSLVMICMKKNVESFEGAFKYLLMSAVASIFLLCATAIIFLTAGNVDFATVSQYVNANASHLPLQMVVAVVLIITGLAIKAGAVPFHAWVPDAYTSATTSVSVLLAGIVSKITGVYTLIRLISDVFAGVRLMHVAFMIIGAVSIVVGALAAIGQKDMKRMLAYSSVSQVGYIVLAAGLGTPLGIAAALLHFFNHATFKSLLFINSYAVEAATGTRDMDRLGGLAARMPLTAGTSTVGFLSTAGIPPLSGFWSKLLIILALLQSGEYAFAAIALAASILTLAYFLIMQKKVFFGKLKEEWAQVREASALNTAPAMVLAGVSVLVGLLFPFLLIWMQAQGLL